MKKTLFLGITLVVLGVYLLYNLQMPKNAKKNVYKEKEFQMYVLWKSLPAYFRGMKKEQLHSHGFTDPLIMKIATIRSQTAFAKKFRIKDLGTLTDWNSKIKKEKLDTNVSHTAFQKQAHVVNDVLATLPETHLKKELFELRKTVASLKKENELLRSQLSPQTPDITPAKPIKQIVPPTSVEVPQPSVPKSVIPDPAPTKKQSFFEKALSFLKQRNG